MPTASLVLCPRCGGVRNAPVGASLGGRTLCHCSRPDVVKKAVGSTLAAASAGASTGDAGGATGTATATANTATLETPGMPSVASVYAAQVARAASNKVCSVCGKDVTHARRMKDAASGKYFCWECGSAQPKHVQHAMDMPCPECHKVVPAVRLVKHQDRYVCPACYAKHAGLGGSTNGKLPLMFVVGIVLLGLILYGLFAMNLF
jgi:hypothetical protein